MPDSKKVINHFEHLLNAAKGNYQDFVDLTVDTGEEILAMLKEQKKDGSFIVIDSQTGKEADTYNIALHEDWAEHLCYCDMDGWAIQDDGSLLLLDECGRYAYADRERFKVVWDA